jgi:MipA family protein
MKNVVASTLIATSLMPCWLHADEDNKEGWSFAVGAGIEREVEYHGSSEHETEADVDIQANYKSANGWEFSSNILHNQLRFPLSDRWTQALWINYEDGRKESDSSTGKLAGLGDIDSSIELGAGVIYQATDRLELYLAGQTYTNDDVKKGSVGFLGADYALIEGDRFSLNVNADISFADSEHLQTEFGVSDTQAASSVYSAYKISSGIKSYGVKIHSNYELTPRWSLHAGVDYEVLAGDSADSPLIQAGDDTEVEVSLGVSYHF